jgi:multiple sugar transport system substrate-binding protein
MARTLKVLLIGALALGACSTKDAPKRAITLQVSGGGAEIDAYQTLVTAFEKANPSIDVKLVPVAKSGDHMTKLTTAFAAGSPPDLFIVNFRRFGQFAFKGVLEPLGPRMGGALKEDMFFPQAIDAFKANGTLTCLPQNISSLVVYFNKTLFKAAGLGEAPKADWTWDDFLAAAKAMTKDTDGDGKTDVYGLGVEPNLVRLAPFVWQAGGEVVDDTENPTRTTLLNEKEIEAMKWFIELRRVHKVSPEMHEAESEGYEDRFANGRLGMILESRRSTPDFRAVEGLDWDVAPLPRYREAATILHADGYCMAKSSANKDAAYRFVEFALGKEGAPILARTGRTVPSNREVATTDAFLDPTQRPASSQVFLDAIPLIRRVPNIETWNEIETKADPIIEEWYYGQEAPPALGIEIDLATRALFAERAK